MYSFADRWEISFMLYGISSNNTNNEEEKCIMVFRHLVPIYH